MGNGSRTASTTCVMDCPDTCALDVTVTDGVVESIRAGKGHPTAKEFICSKVAHFSKRVYHESRLLHPMKRRGPKGAGDFERISWGEAIREVSDRLAEIRDRWGGEAILPYHYGGSNGYFTYGFVDDLYFARMGASRLGITLCAAPTTEAAQGMYGRMPGVAFEDYPLASFILIWGGNPRASNIHLVPYLKEAKKRGAFIALVDPTRTLPTEMIDLHLPVYPGTDLPVALAMIRWWKDNDRLATDFLEKHAVRLGTILEKAGEWTLEGAAEAARVEPALIRNLAQAYADTSPAVLRCGWGLERNRNGGQAVAAILAMPALLAKFGVRGGGYTLSNSGAVSVSKSKLWEDPSPQTRIINMTQLGKALTKDFEPPLRGLFVYNCNPVATVPDQNAILEGMRRDDLFTVVFDQIMTDTARYADILLPATTFLEHRDVRRGYGSYVVGGIRPVIDRQGEARPNFEVFAELGRAMGFDDEAFSWSSDEAFDKLIGAVDMWGSSVDGKTVKEGKIQQFDFPEPSPVQLDTVHPQTPDKKIDLAPLALGPEPYRYQSLVSDKYPLAFLTPASTKTTNSTFGEWSFRELVLTMHPRDAAARNLARGDRARVFNKLGEVFCKVLVDDRVREGVVHMPKGAWMKTSENGQTATALCPDDISEVGGGACFNDARVEVDKP